jgi:glucose-1-phosphate thymidylyltransferase
MKGLILAAGLGTRLRPLTEHVSKALLPLAGAPLISYPLRSLLAAGVGDIGIVTGANEAELRAALADHAQGEAGAANLTFVRQDEQKGLAHAVDCARGFCGGDDFVLLFCDNLFAAPLAPALARWRELRAGGPDYQALVHTITVADPRAFGVAVLDAAGDVQHLEEKPAQPRSDQAVIGIDILTPRIFDAIARIKPSPRGELEITDALMELVHLGYRVHARQLPGWWFDTGTFAALLEVLPPLMDELAVTRRERIFVDPSARVEDCEFVPPVYIGPGCRVLGSRLGPYVSLEKDCTLRHCILHHSLLHAGARLEGVEQAGIVCGADGVCHSAGEAVQAES